MPSAWLTRYRAGGHEEVWAEICALGPGIRDDRAATQAAGLVASEMMSRVGRNAARLELRLRAHGYVFTAEQPGEWPHRVITPPAPNAGKQLDAVEEAIGGPLPISVRAFLLVVGGLDFRGTLPGWTPRYNDALQVITDPVGLGELLADMIDQGALEQEPDGIGKAHLELSADYLHKANISGGPAYGIFVPDAAADPAWHFDPLHATHTFVGYLRATLADAGLPGWRHNPGDSPPAIRDALIAGLEPF